MTAMDTITAELLDDALKTVRLPGTFSNSIRILNDQERAAIIGALLPALKQALAGTGA